MKTKRRIVSGLLGAALCLAGAGSWGAVPTPFEQDVSTSIDLGLEWLANQGAFNNPPVGGSGWNDAGQDAAGLTLLALLEKRAGGDPDAPPQGYAGASATDQARMETLVTFMLGYVNSTSFYAYRDGGYMMALSVYLRTGGPEIVGAPLTLLQAINTLFDRTIANQRTGYTDSAAPYPENNGYWCYTNDGCRDSSTTQLVVAGLAAVRAVYSDAAYADPARLAQLDNATALARTAYARNGVPGQVGTVCGVLPDEKGHGYQTGNNNSPQQTASGTWIQLVGGADVNDPDVQAYLRWLYHRYNYLTLNNSYVWGSNSYWYFLWSSSKAYEYIQNSGVTVAPGNLSPADIGTLDPANAPACADRKLQRDPDVDPRVALFGPEGAGYYGAESKRVYYDYAYTIMSHQCENGQYNCNSPPGRWNTYSSQAYALLVLQRSIGGGCIDSDGDGVCDDEDNCVNTPNPDQADRDGDGVGDVCDNCPDVPNPDQADSNGDGIGDACSAQVAVCDVEPDGDIDKLDLRAISRSRNQPATGPDDPMDADGDGVITVRDVKACIPQCTLPGCAIPDPS